MTKEYGARLRTLRQRAGLTQQKLAQAAGLSVSAVGRLEQGGNPSPETVAALAHALGIPIKALDPPAEPETTPGGS